MRNNDLPASMSLSCATLHSWRMEGKEGRESEGRGRGSGDWMGGREQRERRLERSWSGDWMGEGEGEQMGEGDEVGEKEDAEGTRRLSPT